MLTTGDKSKYPFLVLDLGWYNMVNHIDWPSNQFFQFLLYVFEALFLGVYMFRIVIRSWWTRSFIIISNFKNFFLCHASSRGSSWRRDRTWVSRISGQILYHPSHQRSPQESKRSMHSKGLGTQSQIHYRGGGESVQTWLRFWQLSLDSGFILFPLTTPHLNLNNPPDNILP